MKKDTRKKKISAKGSKDWSEVNALLTNIRETPIRKAEKGSAYVALAEVYLDTMNNVLDQYKKSLDETIQNWDKIDRMGKTFEEKLSLAKIRASLVK